jgi:Xaa-Pro aminopeptidase
VTDQLPLIVESYDEAIRATVLALGGNKVVGSLLWPAKEPDEAGKQLSNALNHRKREVLDPHELALIRRAARAKNIHTLATFEARDAGYADPQPIEPEDERAALQRRFLEGLGQLQQIASRMERLK